MEMFLSVADASRILGVTPQTVRLMVRTGRLYVAAKTVGGIQLFHIDDVKHLASIRHSRSLHAPRTVEQEIDEDTERRHGDHT